MEDSRWRREFAEKLTSALRERKKTRGEITESCGSYEVETRKGETVATGYHGEETQPPGEWRARSTVDCHRWLLTSILRWTFHVIDDEEFARPLGWLEFQSELLLQRGDH
jgi:hypothetical protein